MHPFADRLRGGLFPAVPATLRADGRLDLAAHEAYVAWMVDQPVAGVAVWAHTGRGLLLPAEARREILRDWIAQRGHAAIIAGVGAPAEPGLTPDAYLRATLDMADEALTLGADALMMYAPVLYRGRADQDALILAHAQALARLGAPLLLFYLYEAAGGISYSLPLLGDLLGLPNVVGVKLATLDSVMTFQDVAALLAAEAPEAVLVTGEDRFLGYSIMAGAEAALIGMAAACTAPQAELIASWQVGDLPRFVALTRALDAFSRVTFRAPLEGYVQRLLWCLQATGVVPDHAACDPWAPALGPGERFDVRRAVTALRLAVEERPNAAA